MNSTIRTIAASLTTLGMLALGLVISTAVKAQAYTDVLNSNNTAQITITIRPNVDRSVTITTTNVNMDLGSVDITGGFVSTQTVSPSTVTIGGTFGNTDLLLSANITSAGTPWTFDASSAGISSNSLATWVTFTDVSTVTAPSQSSVYFADNSLLDSASQSYAATRVGDSSATSFGKFENGFNSNNMAVNDKRHMWMFFRMPSDSNTTADQKITFILTVDSGL